MSIDPSDGKDSGFSEKYGKVGHKKGQRNGKGAKERDNLSPDNGPTSKGE
jgi:hypothetical protein